MGTKDPRVDAYIARSADFARPILERLRKTVHAGCPEVEETLKWGAPHFMYKGMLCGMAAFKSHCTFGFWKGSLLPRAAGVPPEAEHEAMGQFGRIESISDLPAEKALIWQVREAAALNDRGVKVPRKQAQKGDRKLEVPAFFMAALRKNKRALATFEGFTYSHKKEYVEWLAEARLEGTRKRRLETALEWMAQGKPRNWKDMRK